MTIKQVHDFILFLIRKEQTGHLSHSEIDLALDAAQMDYYNKLVGYISEGHEANPTRKIFYGKSKAIHTHLMPFKTTYQYNSNDYDSTTNEHGTGPEGEVVMPSDFECMVSLHSQEYSNALLKNVYRPVEFLNEDELSERLDSDILPITDTYPVAVLRGVGGEVNSIDIGSKYKVQLWPKNGQNGEYTYLKRPASPVFAFALSGRTVSYDASGSTQLEWNDSATYNIIYKTCEILGVTIEDEVAVQYAQYKKTEV